jgi:hypothetical protein
MVVRGGLVRGIECLHAEATGSRPIVLSPAGTAALLLHSKEGCTGRLVSRRKSLSLMVRRGRGVRTILTWALHVH